MYKTVQYGSYLLAGGRYQPQLITSISKHADDSQTFSRKSAFTYDAAGDVSPNKRKILLKTLEQLSYTSIESDFLASDNLIFMSSYIELAIVTS